MAMTKAELVTLLSEKTGVTKKQTEEFIKELTSVVTEEMSKGEKLTIPSLGTFSVSHRAARAGRNPKTKEKIMIPESNNVKFKAAKPLRDSVN